jgi:hypothetical protein
MAPEIESAYMQDGPASQRSNNTIFSRREMGFRCIAIIEFAALGDTKDSIRIPEHDLRCRKKLSSPALS